MKDISIAYHGKLQDHTNTPMKPLLEPQLNGRLRKERGPLAGETPDNVN